MNLLRVFKAAGLAVLLAAATAAAQSYPSRPIRLVVPFPPGTSSDFLGRTIGTALGDLYKAQVVVDNRPGAGGWSAPRSWSPLSRTDTPRTVRAAPHHLRVAAGETSGRAAQGRYPDRADRGHAEHRRHLARRAAKTSRSSSPTPRPGRGSRITPRGVGSIAHFGAKPTAPRAYGRCTFPTRSWAMRGPRCLPGAWTTFVSRRRRQCRW